MRIAYLECFSGISGDMLLGALIDAGAPANELVSLPETLGLHGATMTAEHAKRAQIRATYVKVHEGHHHHEHHHEHRSLSAIEKLIERADLSDRAKRNALAVFRKLGAAEAHVHAVPIENVHFHEVGAIDSIIDIVGTCRGLDLLGIEKIYCSALNVGGGTVETEHGTLPVPAPATVELLKSVNAPMYSAGPQVELVTPTGAAVAAALASGFGAMPPMKLTACGYGAGTKNFKDRPNVLRLYVGESVQHAEAAAAAPDVVVIEANIDDMSAQIAGHLAEQALAAGALDVWFTPVQMKKNRPGVMVSLLAEHSDRDRLAGLVFRESSTIGVRIHAAERRTLDRAHVSVDTSFGPLRVKVSSLNGEMLNFAPEYDDCQRVARERGVPLKMVLAEASHKYLEQFGGK